MTQVIADKRGHQLTNTFSDAVDKVGFLDLMHRSTTEEFISLVNASSSAAQSVVNVGGGDPAKNAATHIYLKCAANTSTLDGSNVMHLDISGPTVDLGVLTLGGSEALHGGVNTGVVKLSGNPEPDASDAANILLYGSSHATQAGDFAFRDNATDVIAYDKSATTLALKLAGSNFLVLNNTNSDIDVSKSLHLSDNILAKFGSLGTGDFDVSYNTTQNALVINKTTANKRTILVVNEDNDDCLLLTNSFSTANKSVTLAAPHYNYSGEEAVVMMGSYNWNGVNYLDIGGGNSGMNTVTDIALSTAPTATTLGGPPRFYLVEDQYLEIDGLAQGVSIGDKLFVGGLQEAGCQLELNPTIGAPSSGKTNFAMIVNDAASSSNCVGFGQESSVFWMNVASTTEFRIYRGSTKSFGVNSQLGLSSDVQTDGSRNLITVSDIRLKNVHGAVTYGLNEILNIEPILFNYKSDPLGCPSNIGFSAQNVQAAIPEAVTVGQVDETGTEYLSLNTRGILAALVNAVKEINSKLEGV